MLKMIKRYIPNGEGSTGVYTCCLNRKIYGKNLEVMTC
jgi:hypothetical protein